MELQHQVPFERKKEMGVCVWGERMQCSTHDKSVFVMVGVKIERMYQQGDSAMQ